MSLDSVGSVRSEYSIGYESLGEDSLEESLERESLGRVSFDSKLEKDAKSGTRPFEISGAVTSMLNRNHSSNGIAMVNFGSSRHLTPQVEVDITAAEVEGTSSPPSPGDPGEMGSTKTPCAETSVSSLSPNRVPLPINKDFSLARSPVPPARSALGEFIAVD